MSIEEEIFGRYITDTKKLKEYGFKKQKNAFLYSYLLKEDDLNIEIVYDKLFTGRIIDLNTNEEYVNFRQKNLGTFASYIKEIYIGILIDIRNKCCENQIFKTRQCRMLNKFIKNSFNNDPEFLWKKYPNFAIYRRSDNKKWYALVGNISLNKINKETDDKKEVEFLNIHVNKEDVQELLKKDGYYEAYHMNKKSWITIIFNDSLSDKEIIELIKNSYISVR